MSGDAEQEYFADGVVEDIITALVRLKSFRHRSEFDRSRTKAAQLMCGRSDANSAFGSLEGSIRKSGNRVRITAQLIDGAQAGIFGQIVLRALSDDIFGLQDHVTAGVVGAISPKVQQAEIDRASESVPGLQAYDYYLRGVASPRR